MTGGLRLALAVALVTPIVAGAVGVRAERLPARKYTTADGLASDYITSIYRDSRGFLWFSTRDGLSRFDGVRFTTYGTADGLPTSDVNRVFETRAGIYWIATNGGGLCRFNPDGRRPTRVDETEAEDLLFRRYRVGDEPGSNRINVLLEDRAGEIWIGTDMGLFRMHREGARISFRRVPLSPLPIDVSFHGVHALVEDSAGSLWIGGGWGLTQRWQDGRSITYRMQPKGARDRVNALLLDRDKRLWIGSGSGLMMLEIDAAPRSPAANEAIEKDLLRSASGTAHAIGSTQARTADTARWYTSGNGLLHDSVGSLHQALDGHIWIGTFGGLSEFDGENFRGYRTLNGLVGNYITAMADDAAGNLWVGTVTGVTRILPHGLVTFDEADGFRQSRVHSLAQDESGRLLVLSGDYLVSRFDGKRFESARPPLPADATCSWMSPCGYLDRAGEWWMLTTAGLYRFPKVPELDRLAQRRPRAVYTQRDGLEADNAYNAFEDRRGNLWIGTAPHGLVQFQRSNAGWRILSEADGLPPVRDTANMASAFAEDAAGQVWIGFHNGGLGRFRNGRFQLFESGDGVPVGMVTALYRDKAGGLWIGTNQSGLVHVDDPSATRPRFAAVPSTRGLNVRCVTEDRSGRIYAGTSRGVTRIDPLSGRTGHFGLGEGLASEFVTAALQDSQGMLWFGTIAGLSRLDPAAGPASESSEPPRVLISALRVRGVPQRLSEIGDVAPATLTLAPDQNQIEVEFFGITPNTAESLKYQYRLEGVDAEWSAPTEHRSIAYGRLPTGSHRFLVRSIRSDGAVSSTPAVVSLTVVPHVYETWWFISLVALSAVGAGFVLYRLRIAQLLRVERVRARIATDLHDDIGASLSQIAILAEVAQHASGSSPPGPAGPLARIAETSRNLVDSMSDIVWAVNPQADSLADLVHRMRRFAEDTVGASDIELIFRAPDSVTDHTVGADARREIYLILKESVTNIAKHSRATHVTIDLACNRNRLRLRVHDDGVGFEPELTTDGNGVASMRRRVTALGGKLTIESAPARGTTILLDVDLRRLAKGVGGHLLPE